MSDIQSSLTSLTSLSSRTRKRAHSNAFGQSSDDELSSPVDAMELEPSSPPQAGRSSPPIRPLLEQMEVTSVIERTKVRQPLTKEPFLDQYSLAIFNPLQLIFCVECNYCLGTPQVAGHLRATHQSSVLRDKALQVFQDWCEEHRIRKSGSDEVLARHSTKAVEPYPLLPTVPGFACPVPNCRKLGQQKAKIQEHIRVTHPSELLEPEPCSMQALFATKRAGYVRVDPLLSIQDSEAQPNSLSRLWSLEQKSRSNLFDPPILQNSDSRAKHPFLHESGWAHYLAGKSVKETIKMKEGMEPSHLLTETMAELVGRVRALCTTATYEPRCLLNSDGSAQGVCRQAHGDLIHGATWERYTRTWTRFIAMVVNHASSKPETRWFYLSEDQENFALNLRAILAADSPIDDVIPHLVSLSYNIITGPTSPSITLPTALMGYCILANVGNGGLVADPYAVAPFLAGVQSMIRSIILFHAAALSAASGGDLVHGGPTLSLLSAVEAEQNWTTEGRGTAFSWVRRMLHLATKLQDSGNRMPKFIWSREDGRSFLYGGQRITVSEWSTLLQASIRAAQDQLDEVFNTFGIPSRYQITKADLRDNPAERSINYSFMSHGYNTELLIAAQEVQDMVIDSGKFGKVVGGETFWFRQPILRALATTANFLKTLAVAIYLTGGQPPRGTELLSTQIRNSSSRIRNIFIIDGHVVIVTFVNKTSYAGSGDKAIARALPKELGHLLLTYLMFVKPSELSFQAQVGVADEDIALGQLNLFLTKDGPIETQDLNPVIHNLVVANLPEFPEGLTISDLRQIASYMGIRIVGPTITEERVALLDLQAGHTTEIAKKWYGNEASTLTGSLTEGQLEAFMEVSFAHHRAFGLVKSSVSVTKANEQMPTTVKSATPRPNLSYAPTTGSVQDETRIPTNFTTINSPDVDANDHDMLDANNHDTLDAPSPSITMDETWLPDDFTSVNPLHHTTGVQTPLSSNFTTMRFESDQSEIVVHGQTASTGVQRVHENLSKDQSVLTREIQALSRRLDQLVLSAQRDGRPANGQRFLPVVDTRLLVALRAQLDNPTAAFRSFEQAEAVQIAAERRQHLLAVLPTGMGKGEVFFLNAQCERPSGRTTVVLVPLATLRDQHTTLAAKRHLVAHAWPTETFGDIVFCIFEVAGYDFFIKKLRALHEQGLLARIVVDECHYAFGAELGFRTGMRCLQMLGSLGVPIVLLTGTLPPHKVHEQLRLVGIDSAAVVRAPSTRHNIYYAFHHVPKIDTAAVNARNVKAIAKCAVAALKEAFDSIVPPVQTTIAPGTQDGDRTLVAVFFQWKELIDAVHDLEPRWLRMHADLPLDVKKHNMEQWGVSSEVMLATSILGLGFHRPNLRGTIHWGLPRNLVDFAQESGRVGRDGRKGWAIVMWYEKEEKPMIDDWGKGLLIDALESKGCRRLMLDTFLDGQGTNCFTQPACTVLCDNCEHALARASNPHSLESIPPKFQTVTKPIPNQPVTNRQGVLDMLNMRCAACFVAGRGLKEHTHIGCPNTLTALGMSKEQLADKYKRWKRSIGIPNGHRICFKCHLVQSPPWHTWDDNTKPKCQFEDSMSQVVFHALQLSHLSKAISQWLELPLANLEGTVAQWLPVVVQQKGNLKGNLKGELKGELNEGILFDRIWKLALDDRL